ncbi:DNA-processing protein DprA [Flavihumibacter fluvii]|uniref:DNA-processing protein DprA n=1 Tax=Flavihumibacter fluvii TaxID=2838157 RepID=UPI001BDE20E3|nr:DNA-processing protein DprA [Flavihumibacter fluvii]ULQ53024.1 DNA-processing protein DprA [Flavihumibacter fluvii]
MYSEKIYQIALSLASNIGHVHAKVLVDHFKTATAIFSASLAELEAIPGIGGIRARSIRHFNDFAECEKMQKQVEAHGISTLFIGEDNYPIRLLNCYDPPTLLYCKGKITLNNQRTVAVIGTRNHTEYGRGLTEKFIRDLAGQNITIISGMAYGIDGLAHKAALKYGLPTIGILAHGLDEIYPPEHQGLAREMLRQNCGFITEFPIGKKPEKHHFPVRNRIVAGLSDAVVVVETGIKGGSMITASLASGYNCEVFAFPGRTTDQKSSGCNLLIRTNKAILLTDSAGFLAEKDWEQPKQPTIVQAQLSLPHDLNPAETIILHLLGMHDFLPIDELYIKTGLTAGNAAAAILTLELKNLIETIPGKRYRLRT